MLSAVLSSILIVLTLYSKEGGCISLENETQRNFIYTTYEYNKIFTVIVNDSTEQIMNFMEDDNHLCGCPTRVHVSSNDTIDSDHPLFITATQQKGVSSWELPLVVETGKNSMQFKDMARTLCPYDAGPNITSVNRPLLHLTTSSPSNVSVNIQLRRVDNFFVAVNTEVNITVKPSTPKYHYFSFNEYPNVTRNVDGFLPKFNYTIPKSVLLIIESDDDVCAIVSIQNNSCPVFDNEKDIGYQGFHLTMTSKGGITLTQSQFPTGFYIMFIVRQTDDVCTGASETTDSASEMADGLKESGRVKTFRFRIIPTISYKEYITGALVTLALVAIVAILVPSVAVPHWTCKEEVTIIEEEPLPGPSSRTDLASGDVTLIVGDVNTEDSFSESEGGSEVTPTLTVAGLSRAKPRAQARRSDRYFWSALTVAVVYALPVVQLLFTYQHMVFQTGNQDLCYYNFLCAHPLGYLSDFNHVYSNVGYVVLGAVFMLQVRVRQLKGRKVASPDRGIPQHAGLFYSMGLALVMEGVLSACYHLCPNKMNFQFDSSFMYVIAVLCMVKLYQSRHADVNASAHTTFILLAFFMAIGLFGIMYPSVYFWVAFTLFHLATCFVLTLKIYYVGRFKLERAVFGRVRSALGSRGARALRPSFIARAALLAVANVANWTLAGFGLYEHNKDFARHLLAILMGNAILYTIFYMMMKLVHRERITVYTWIYFVLAHVAWITAYLQFKNSRTKWSETPAMSRRHNAQCSSLDFYDTHDLWHGLSAAAIFLSFNMLLTLDDALRETPRHLIPVF